MKFSDRRNRSTWNKARVWKNKLIFEGRHPRLVPFRLYARENRQKQHIQGPPNLVFILDFARKNALERN